MNIIVATALHKDDNILIKGLDAISKCMHRNKYESFMTARTK